MSYSDSTSPLSQNAGRVTIGSAATKKLSQNGGCHIEMQNATPVMGQHQKHVKDLKTDSGHGEKVDGDQLLGMILQECAPGLRRGLQQRTMYLLTLLSPMWMPSLNSSPWMRGAPPSPSPWKWNTALRHPYNPAIICQALPDQWRAAREHSEGIHELCFCLVPLIESSSRCQLAAFVVCCQPPNWEWPHLCSRGGTLPQNGESRLLL